MYSSVAYLIRFGKTKVIEVVHILRGAVKNIEKSPCFLVGQRAASIKTNFLKNRKNIKVRIKRIVFLYYFSMKSLHHTKNQAIFFLNLTWPDRLYRDRLKRLTFLLNK